ncbi:hypothetical protein [Bowmanella yangjiangensis]|uniref:RDD domain-containing protein n=1 Tax=Bowmanella yangjiangensis TaxID=2811230 RepID=A0ABS3CZY7_9ALTE|nr:hypothetical protein [Bowmanella yangjiangensis]MBN7821686.1 hypothetical protein [Bowmanella yangjiangensis]
MSDNRDPLLQNWQSQQVDLPDLAELKAKWRKERFKQWIYVLLDWLSVVFVAVVILYFLPKKELVQIWMVAIFVFTFAAAAWNTWLRRLSLFRSRDNLHEHLQTLRQQNLNNIRLARFTQWGLVIMLISVAVLLLATWYQEQPPWEAFQMRLLRVFAWVGGVCALGWWWTIRILKKAQQQLEWLDSIEQSSL